MNTITDTRRWNQTVSWTQQLIFTLYVFLLMPVGYGYAQGTTGEAAGGSGSPDKTLAFTKLMLHAQGRYDIRLVPEEYHNTIVGRLQHHGIAVHHSQTALFNQNAPTSIRFMLGGIADELTCGPIHGGSADTVCCEIAITWELFDQTHNTVVYKAKTRSFTLTSLQRDPPAQTVGKMILGALDSLMSRERFFAAMRKDGVDTKNTAQYPVIDTEDLTWQELHARQNQVALAERQRAHNAWQAQQRQWAADTLPLRNKRKPYLALGVTLNVIAGISLLTGGILEIVASANHNRVENYRDDWMETADPYELEELKQDIVDAEEKRDVLHNIGIGMMSVGGVSLITGIVFLVIMPELPPRPMPPRNARSPLQLRPVIGATHVGLFGTF